jgi:H+/Cl- antiporter ClcA
MAKLFKYFILLVFVGLLSGVLSSLFLYSLNLVTDLRMSFPHLLFGLPVFGFIYGSLLKRIPPYINQGIPYLLQEINNPEKKVSTLTAPFIFISSIGTHLFGGSAGREGVGVLMGVSAAHLLAKIHPVYKVLRQHLIYAGVAAGFSSMFGTPLAGMLFSFEIHAFKEFKRIDLVLTTLLSALIADRMTRFLGPNHHRYILNFDWNLSLVPMVFLIGIISGVGALVFCNGTKYFSGLISKRIHSHEWKLFTGGLIVCLLVVLTESHDYVGIGTHMIEKSFHSPMNIIDYFLKCLLTIITLSAGFKGGEVTPLFFMGATLSNSVMSLFSFYNYALNSSLGMVAIFGAVTLTPIASTIIACELFGWEISLLALGVCVIARALMGKKSIYRP